MDIRIQLSHNKVVNKATGKYPYGQRKLKNRQELAAGGEKLGVNGKGDDLSFVCHAKTCQKRDADAKGHRRRLRSAAENESREQNADGHPV
jgi:hypothetical protein